MSRFDVYGVASSVGEGYVKGVAFSGGATPRGRGLSLPVGDMLRVRGRESCPRRRRLSPFGRTRTRPYRNVPERAALERAALSPTASADAAPKGAGEEQRGEGPRLLVLGRDDDFVVNREAHRSSNEAVLGGAVVQRGGTFRIIAGSDGHCGAKGD